MLSFYYNEKKNLKIIFKIIDNSYKNDNIKALGFNLAINSENVKLALKNLKN